MLNNLELIGVINNPESIIEVYLNTNDSEVVELKRLNDNRYKTYNYSVDKWLNRYQHHPLSVKLQAQI